MFRYISNRQSDYFLVNSGNRYKFLSLDISYLMFMIFKNTNYTPIFSQVIISNIDLITVSLSSFLKYLF